MIKSDRFRAKNIKQRILEAAFVCLEKKPVAHVRLIDIAKQAKVSRPALKYHYKDMNSLFRDVISFILEDLRTQSMKSIELGKDDIHQILEGYCYATFLWGVQKPVYMRHWLYFYYLCAFEPSFREINDSIRSVGRERIKNILYKGLATQVLNPRIASKVEELAVEIQGIVTGNTIMAFTESHLDPMKCAELTHKAVKNLLRVD